MFLTMNDGVKLAYSDQGTGQPIVILTGFGGAKEIWQAQIPALLAAGYRVINVDARNQGQSQHTVKGRRISRHGMDLAEVIQQLMLKHVILLGNSMGAATIFAYLSLFGDANVGAVIDIDQSPKMINTPDWPYGFKQATWTDYPDYFRMPLGPSTFKHIDDKTFALVQAAAQKAPFDAKLNEPFLFDHAAADWRDVVAQLSKPLLILAGAQSPYFNPDFAAITAAMAVKGEAKVIQQAGHIVMAEQSQATTEAILSFLKRV